MKVGDLVPITRGVAEGRRGIITFIQDIDSAQKYSFAFRRVSVRLRTPIVENGTVSSRYLRQQSERSTRLVPLDLLAEV
jgi:hypothetical protein